MEQPCRKTLRLQGYDYSQAGCYFITVCTHNREHLFWNGGRAGLEPAPTNRFGDVVRETWLDLPRHIGGIHLGHFVVMPNHVHGIIVLRGAEDECVGAGSKPARPPLTEAVRQFKTFSARHINQIRGTTGCPVWQKGFYDHIIRNQADYLRIWKYIDTNPARWREDCYYQA